jgi:anaphase-promoting complex subunit 2
MPQELLNVRKKRVFDSVFGGSNISQPTPVATPLVAFTAPGQAFGGPIVSTTDRHAQLSAIKASRHSSGVPVSESDHVREQVQWDRSWHTVTYTLVTPDVPSDVHLIEAWEPELRTADAGFSEALRDLLDPQTRLPSASHTEDLVIWHTNQVRHHFLRQVLPILLDFSEDDGPETLLFRVVKTLGAALRPYFTGLSIILGELESLKPGTSPGISQRFSRDLHAVISNSVSEKIAGALKAVLRRHVFAILGLPIGQDLENFALPAESYITEKARGALLKLVESLQEVGLAGEKFQITFAEIMNDSMAEYVCVCCQGIWSAEALEALQHHNDQDRRITNDGSASILPRTAHHTSPSQCATNLCEWIENRYAKLAVQVFHTLATFQTNRVDISWTQVEKWKEMGIGHLGALRTNELFDIVVNWPHSSAALDDLRTAITTPQRRLHLTDVFAKTLTERLLHPGASTLQILQTYISMISSFHALDHSKVLLDRVAYPLQLYLCSREDTVRIIITGLLSETEDAQGNPLGPGGDKLVELALLLNKGEEQLGQKANDEELDWHDADWLPDPVDAGPGYKRSKSADIIGTLISVLGSQEVFIKEFQNIIGEHLLKNEGGFEKEVSHYLPALLV